MILKKKKNTYKNIKCILYSNGSLLHSNNLLGKHENVDNSLHVTTTESKQVINMNFNKVKKMKNSDLGRQPSRTKRREISVTWRRKKKGRVDG